MDTDKFVEVLNSRIKVYNRHLSRIYILLLTLTLVSFSSIFYVQLAVKGVIILICSLMIFTNLGSK